MSETEQARVAESPLSAPGNLAEHLGAALIDAIDSEWKRAAGQLIDMSQHGRICRIRQRLLKKPLSRPRTSSGLNEMSAHFPPLKPNQVLSALGPRWWHRIDAGTLTPELVPYRADPLSVYAKHAPAWRETIRDMRSGALAHALFPLFEGISTGLIRLVGVRRPARAVDAFEQIPVAELRFRQWSVDTTGTLALYPPGAAPICFSAVRIADGLSCEAATPAGQFAEPCVVPGQAERSGKSTKARQGTKAWPVVAGPAATSTAAVPKSKKRKPGPTTGSVDRFGAKDRALYKQLKRLTHNGELSVTAAAQRLAEGAKSQDTERQLTSQPGSHVGTGTIRNSIRPIPSKSYLFPVVRPLAPHTPAAKDCGDTSDGNDRIREAPPERRGSTA